MLFNVKNSFSKIFFSTDFNFYVYFLKWLRVKVSYLKLLCSSWASFNVINIFHLYLSKTIGTEYFLQLSFFTFSFIIVYCYLNTSFILLIIKSLNMFSKIYFQSVLIHLFYLKGLETLKHQPVSLFVFPKIFLEEYFFRWLCWYFCCFSVNFILMLFMSNLIINCHD